MAIIRNSSRSLENPARVEMHPDPLPAELHVKQVFLDKI
jgi:hypothetical protein